MELWWFLITQIKYCTSRIFRIKINFKRGTPCVPSLRPYLNINIFSQSSGIIIFLHKVVNMANHACMNGSSTSRRNYSTIWRNRRATRTSPVNPRKIREHFWFPSFRQFKKIYNLLCTCICMVDDRMATK